MLSAMSTGAEKTMAPMPHQSPRTPALDGDSREEGGHHERAGEAEPLAGPPHRTPHDRDLFGCRRRGLVPLRGSGSGELQRCSGFDVRRHGGLVSFARTLRRRDEVLGRRLRQLRMPNRSGFAAQTFLNA